VSFMPALVEEPKWKGFRRASHNRCDDCFDVGIVIAHGGTLFHDGAEIEF
jgi:hypothetical protein